MNRRRGSKWQVATILVVAAVMLSLLPSLGSADSRVTQPPGTPTRTLLQVEGDLAVPGDDAPAAPRETAADATIRGVTDAEVMEGYPGAGCGNELIVRVGYDDYLNPDGKIVRGLAKFNLAAIPAYATVTGAQLHVYLVESWDYPGYERTITTYRVAQPWAEDIVTWSTAPAIAEAYGSTPVQHDAATGGRWYAFEVTNLVRNWHDGVYPNYGLALLGPEHSGTDSSWKAFATSETIYPPQLTVGYVSAQGDGAVTIPASAPGDVAFASRQAGDFGLSIAPPAQTVVQGTPATYTVTLSVTEEIDEPVALSLASEPAGATGTFSSNPTLPPAEVTLTVPTGELAGAYTLLITGTSGAFSHTVGASLTVTRGLQSVFLPLVTRGSQTDVNSGLLLLSVGVADYLYMEPPPAASRAGAPGYDILMAVPDLTDTGDTFSTRGNCALFTNRLFNLSQTPALRQGGCAVENVLTLADRQADKASVRDAILNWLDPRETAATTVVIHFSAHGGYGPDLAPVDEADGYDEYLAPYDLACDPCGATPETTNWLIETGIRDDELAEWLAHLESQRIVLLIDSCFSGGMIEGDAAATRAVSPQAGAGRGVAAGDGIMADVAGPGRVILTASAADEPSWEFGALKNGAFTYYLVEALQSPLADGNLDGLVSAEEAFDYLSSRVFDYVYSQTGEAQTPQIYDGVPGEINLAVPFAVTSCPQ